MCDLRLFAIRSRHRYTIAALSIYLVGIVAANLLASAFGPVATPCIAFTLIGLDLSLRDYLQLVMKPRQMFLLIVVGGLLSYAAVPESGMIAMASAAAFTAASAADWSVFSLLRQRPWLVRANVSNVAGAMVDSTIFVTIAFGFAPEAIFWQAIAKIAGGFVWSLLLARMFRR